MTKQVRALIGSHLATLAVGVYIGKSINADELNMYREANESFWTKTKRRAGGLGIGVLALGAVYVVIRVARSKGEDKATV